MSSSSLTNGCHEVVIVLVGAVEGFAYMDADVSNYIHQEGEQFVRGEQRCGAHRAPHASARLRAPRSPCVALTASCVHSRQMCVFCHIHLTRTHTKRARGVVKSALVGAGCALVWAGCARGAGGMRSGCGRREKRAGVGGVRSGCGRAATAGALRWRVRAGPSCCRARSRSRGGYRP